MIISEKLLVDSALEFGVALDETAVKRFNNYAELLIEWNQKINLTAITEPDDIVIKHFADSLSLFSVIDIPQGAKVIDVGTGAGFPGIALLIARPDIKLTLLDSTNKKLNFLNTVLEHLGLVAQTLHARAEDAGHNPKYRESYDFVTARAVANLRNLAEYCLPFVRPGGYFVPMKSNKLEQEVLEARKAIKVMGGEIKATKTFDLGEDANRSILIIKKISQISPKYPRPSAQIAKHPIE